MKDILMRFTSRKFLLTVSLCALFAANKQWHELMLSAGAYLGVEGFGDAAERYAKPKFLAAASELENTKMQLYGDMPAAATDVDKSQLVAGSMAGQ